jgi:hypothetical protein
MAATRRCQAAGLIGDHHPDITTQGEKGGMGDVQDAQQTVDQRQAQGDKGVDAALDQALGDQFDKQHATGSFRGAVSAGGAPPRYGKSARERASGHYNMRGSGWERKGPTPSSAPHAPLSQGPFR